MPELAKEPEFMLRWPVDSPLGYSGPSGILPREEQENSHFVPMEDRWRIGLPPWDRYDQGHPPGFEYPYTEGSLWNPFNQNVLKGDYAILGQHNFFVLTAIENLLIETRQVPTPTTPFESTGNPDQEEFFGDPDQCVAQMQPFVEAGVEVFNICIRSRDMFGLVRSLGKDVLPAFA